MPVTSPSVVVYDRHDAALYLWRDAGVREATLLHIDAHPDAHTGTADFVEIGNFIWHAMREGLVARAYWAVPDPSWASPPVRRDLAEVALELSGGAPPTSGDRRIETSVSGRPFTIGPLDAFSAREQQVLLDVDVDYLLIRDVREVRPPVRDPWPWLWPRDLVGRLDAVGVKAKLTTIATSVTGGFTPVRWKHLGVELRARLVEEAPAIHAFDVLEHGIRRLRDGDSAEAERAFPEAASICPTLAAPWYWLAQVLFDRGAMHDAREAYARALSIDPEYRAPFSEGRALQYRARDHAAAQRAFERTLALDPDDVYAWLGLGELAIAARAWTRATEHLERAVRLEPTLVDAHRALARALEGCGRRAEAIRMYDRSLHFALTGGRLIAGPVTTRSFGVHDPAHANVHARIAWLQTRTRTGDPVASCRIALSDAPWRLDVHALLAWHYLRVGSWGRAVRQMATAATNVPGAARRFAGRLRRHGRLTPGSPS